MKKLANYSPFVALFLLPLLFYPAVTASSWRSSSDVHALLEFASSLLAITAGIMVLLHFFSTGRRFFLIISIGFVLIGTEEFVHAIFSFERIWPEIPSTFRLAISTTWLAGNFILATSFFIAILFGKGEIAPLRRRLYAVVYNVVAFTIAAFLSLLIFESPLLPSFVQLGSITKELIELSLALLFLVAFLLYSNLYIKRQSRSPLLWSIVAFIIFRVEAHIFVFDARAFYDAHWDIAHLIVLLSYLFPIFGVWGETLKLHRSAHAQLIELEKEMVERKQAEEETLRERALFDQLVETAPEGIAISDAQGRVMRVNAEFVRMFGYGVDELVGQRIDDLVAPPAFQEEARAITRSTRRGEKTLLETVRRRKDGTLVDVSLIVAPILIAGKLEAGYGIYRDITERKRAEEENQRERAFFDQLVETAPEGVAITGEEGKVLRVNAEFVRMFGYGADEAVGQCIDDLVVPPARQEEARAITRSSGQGEESVLETVRRRKDGTLVDVSLISAPILVAGKQEAVYAIYRDITGRKQAEAQLRQSQKMEAIGELAGGVAHDFNNLLTGILGNIALMRSSLPPADPLLENLNAAETAARRAADLTKGLLTFSRSAVVLPVPMNITAALDASLTLLKQSLPATVEIVRDYDQTVWNVLLDQSQMTQILLNLAVNARDAMNDKGTLAIRARNEVVGEEYVRNHRFARTGEFVHLSVTDTGPGMSAEVMQHLFEPFYTTKPVGSGTGLGLSIVYGAVKQAGGWVTVESKTDEGATFDMYIPRCLSRPTESSPPRSPSGNVHEETVLVVEDESIVRTVAQALLSRSGYTVLTAPDGVSALNVLRDHPVGIELILLDMTMPGMTTGEIVQGVRALDPTVPILLNSGYTSNDAVKHMLAEGSVQGFLGKPYDLDQLLENAQRLLHRG